MFLETEEIQKVWNGENSKDGETLHNKSKWGDISYCKGCHYWVESWWS